MPNLRVRPKGAAGLVHQVTPESAGWTYVGFEFHRLKAGERLGAWTGDREVCLVLVSGKALVEAGNSDFGEIGGRMSPFEGAPHAVYAPGGGGPADLGRARAAGAQGGAGSRAFASPW